ncbi:hypothetical protein CTA2_202 [Colletotrichum tanaceti]|uniref:Uncharacterized protein n=1 Tax=Colletotrichum tanaceti TaxID=1306861 RepID=A0A4U6XA41_9PEZI|nr:hypothetical protein CTA2_202 [Colletotrichum tanaceti]TKW52518.1 hypothetical protein CTA1_8800 [Colletotrichum tanaceti]
MRHPTWTLRQPFGHAELAEPGGDKDCESGHDGSPQIKKSLFIRPSYRVVVAVVVFSRRLVPPFRVSRYDPAYRKGGWETISQWIPQDLRISNLRPHVMLPSTVDLPRGDDSCLPVQDSGLKGEGRDGRPRL